MIRRGKNQDGVIAAGDGLEQEIIPAQEYIKRAVEEGIEDDDGFSGDTWLSGVDFVRSQGLIDRDSAIWVPLSAIKSGFNMNKFSGIGRS